MQAAMIAQWTGPVPGREADSLRLFDEVNDFNDKLLADGKIESYDWFVGTFGPKLYVAKGERDALIEVQMMPEMRRLLAKSQLINNNFEYGLYMTGDSLRESLQAYAQTGQELGYM